MNSQFDDFDNAAMCAFDHSTNTTQQLRDNAASYCENIKLSPDGWKKALEKISEATINRKSPSIIFWAVECVFYAILHRFPSFSDDEKNMVRNNMMMYVRDILPKQPTPHFIRGKLTSLFVALIRHDFPTPWVTFFQDFESILPKIIPGCPQEPLELYVQLIKSLEEDVIQSSASFSALRQQTLSMTVKDALRNGPINNIVSIYHQIIVALVDTNHQLIISTLNSLGVLIQWIELTLVVNEKFFPLLFNLVSHTNQGIQVASLNLIKAICDKGMSHSKRLMLFSHIKIIDFITDCRTIQTIFGGEPAHQQQLSSQGSRLTHPTTTRADFPWDSTTADIQDKFTDLTPFENPKCIFAQLTNSITSHLIGAYNSSIEDYVSVISVKLPRSSTKSVKNLAFANNKNVVQQSQQQSQQSHQFLASVPLGGGSLPRPTPHHPTIQHDPNYNYVTYIQSLSPEDQGMAFQSSAWLLTIIPTLLSFFDDDNFTVPAQINDSLGELLNLLRTPGVFDELYIQAHYHQFQTMAAAVLPSPIQQPTQFNNSAPTSPPSNGPEHGTITTSQGQNLNLDHYLYHTKSHLPYALFGPGPLAMIGSEYQRVMALAQNFAICPTTKTTTPPPGQPQATLSPDHVPIPPRLLTLGYRSPQNGQTLDPSFFYQPNLLSHGQLPTLITPSPNFHTKKIEIFSKILYHLTDAFQYPSRFSFANKEADYDEYEVAFESFRTNTLERLFKLCGTVDLQYVLYFIHRHCFHALQLFHALLSVGEHQPINTPSITTTSPHHYQQTQPSIFMISNWLTTPIYQYIPTNFDLLAIQNPNAVLNTTLPVTQLSTTFSQQLNIPVGQVLEYHPFDSNVYPSTFNIRSFFPAGFPLTQSPVVSKELHPVFIMPLKRQAINPPRVYLYDNSPDLRVNVHVIHIPTHNPSTPPFSTPTIQPLNTTSSTTHSPQISTPSYRPTNSRLIPLLTPLLTRFESIYKLLSLLPDLASQAMHTATQFAPFGPIIATLMANPLFSYMGNIIDLNNNFTLPSDATSAFNRNFNSGTQHSQLLSTFAQLFRTGFDPYHSPSIHPHLIKPQSYYQFISKFSHLLLAYPAMINEVLPLMVVPTSTAVRELQKTIAYTTSKITPHHQLHQHWNVPMLLQQLSSIVDSVLSRKVIQPDQPLLQSMVCTEYLLQTIGTTQQIEQPSTPQDNNQVDISLLFCDCVAKLSNRTYIGSNSLQCLFTVLGIPLKSLNNLILAHDPIVSAFSGESGHEIYALRISECIHSITFMLKDLQIFDILDPKSSPELLNTQRQQLNEFCLDLLTIAMKSYLISNHHTLIRSKLLTLLHCLLSLLQDSILPYLYPILTLLVSHWDRFTISSTVQLICQMVKTKTSTTIVLSTPTEIGQQGATKDYGYAILVKLWPLIAHSFEQIFTGYDDVDQRLIAYSNALATFHATTLNSNELDHTQQSPTLLPPPSDATLLQDRSDRDAIRKLFLWLIRDLCTHELFYIFEYHAQYSPPLDLPLTSPNIKDCNNGSNIVGCNNPNSFSNHLNMNRLLEMITMKLANLPPHLQQIVHDHKLPSNIDYRYHYFTALQRTITCIRSVVTVMTQIQPNPILNSPNDTSILKHAVIVSKLLLQALYRVDMNTFQYSQSLHELAVHTITQKPKITTLILQVGSVGPIQTSPLGLPPMTSPQPNPNQRPQLITQPPGFNIDPHATLLNTIVPIPNPQMPSGVSLQSPYFETPNAQPPPSSSQNPPNNIPSLPQLLIDTIIPAVALIPFITPHTATLIKTPINYRDPTIVSILKEIISFIRLIGIISAQNLHTLHTLLISIISPDKQPVLQQFLQLCLTSRENTVDILEALFSLYKQLIIANRIAASGQIS